MKYKLSPAARRELNSIWFYVAKQSGHANAERLSDKIKRMFFAIAVSPGIGRPRDDIQTGLRSIAVGNYLIFYRVDTIVEIARVIHGARDYSKMFDE